MQSHKDIARASSRANRLETSLAWAGLSQALNAVGPPCKSDEDWRRVWKDWKCTIKKKTVDRGWPHKHEPMSSTEEALASILQFDKFAEDESQNNSFGPALKEGSSSQFDLREMWEEDPDDLYISARHRKKIKMESRCSSSSGEATGYRELSYRASGSTKKVKVKKDELQEGEHANDPLLERPPRKSKIVPKISQRPTKEETSSDSFENSATLKEIAGELRALNETTKAATKSIMSIAAKMCELMERGLEERQQHNALLKKLLNNRK
ncbi:uncharacterized protein [Drosophila suzukii]|uniref:Regulatory protein zeste n=1 Tax=Drosophila suzukii TaxID=28584 RepID=A0AB39YX34_DROSZ